MEFLKESAYTHKLPINVKKMIDLKSLIQYIPQEFTDFYLEIYDWPSTTADTAEYIEPDETDD